ncbi:MAG: hypothetical protein ACKO96_04685, partial [Flammeovirgaceae bacterium]
MKKYIIFFLLIAYLPVMSQEIAYNDLSGITKSGGYFTSYIAKDGNTYKVGDDLRIMSPSPKAFKGYFAFVAKGENWLTRAALPATQAGSETKSERVTIGGNKKNGFGVICITKSTSAPK